MVRCAWNIIVKYSDNKINIIQIIFVVEANFIYVDNMYKCTQATVTKTRVYSLLDHIHKITLHL